MINNFLLAAGNKFSLEADIAWHSLYYPGGTLFAAESYGDGAQVDVIPDEMGSTADNLLVDTVSARAVYEESDSLLNGAPAVSFPYSGSFGNFSTGAWTKTDPTLTYSLVVVYHRTDVNDSQTNYVLSDHLNTNTYSLRLSTSGEIGFNSGGSPVYTTGVGDINTSRGVVTVTKSGSSDELYVDGNLEVTFSAGDSTINGLHVGSREDGFQDFTGSIGFVGLYDGDITAHPQYGNLQYWCIQQFGVSV